MTASYEENRAEALRHLAGKQPEEALSVVHDQLLYPGELENRTQWQETLTVLARITEALPEGHPDRELAGLFQLAASDPDDAQVLLDIGYDLIELDAPEVAATILARANELVPANATILEELVSALERAEQYGEARRFLHEQPDLVREDFLMRYLLGFYTLMCGDLTAGRELVDRLAPEQDHPHLTLEQRLQMSERLRGMLEGDASEAVSSSDHLGEITVGGLYAAANDDGSIGIWKVLAVDEIAVNLRKYSNKFDEIPSRVDPTSLKMGMDLDALRSGDEGALGIGHVPFARELFWEMEPELVQVEPVLEEELAGYRMWLDGVEPPAQMDSSLTSETDTDQKKWWQFWN